MDFNSYIDQAWSDHATKTEELAAGFAGVLPHLQQASEVLDFAHLVAHVMGQHLGRWQEGITWIHKLRALSLACGADTHSALDRTVASLELAAGLRADLQEFSGSDKIRIFAMAAAAVSEAADIQRAKSFFVSALELAHLGLPKDDPANRALAVTGNNLACALEERPARTPEQSELMILAAEAARKYWEIAGTWLQVERAEYRLARSLLQAGDLRRAMEHAQQCIEIVNANGAPGLELFFGYEAIALVEKARRNEVGLRLALSHAEKAFALLPNGDKAWCQKSLEALQM